MAIIYSYPLMTETISGDDLLLMTDVSDNKKTKSVKVSALPSSGAGITLTTTGTSGPATLVGTVLNVPNYNTSGQGDTYTLQAEAKSSNSVPLKLDAATGSDSTVNLTEGSNITLTRNSATEITIASTGGGTPASPTNSVQFNNAGAFGGSELLTYASRILEVGAVGASGGSHLKIYGGGSDDAKLTLYCSAGTHGVTIEGPQHNQGTNYTLKLPKTITTQTVYSSGGRILESDANGALQWITTPTSGGSPGGLTTQYQYNNSGAFAGTNLLRFDADAIHVGIAGGTPEKGKMILYSDGTSTGAPTIELKNSANAHGVTIKGSLDAGGSADYDFILPIANGASGQYLKLDSNLALEYTNIPTYPITTYSNAIDNRVITATSANSVNGEQYLTFDGTTLTVADVNTDVKITGNGISFPGQADELNDYEEGTWTPTPYDSGGNPTTSIATGTYIKVGDLVNCYFYLNITSTGYTPGAAMVIQGLPFAGQDTNGQRGGVIISRNDGTNFIQQQATSGLVEANNLRLKRMLITISGVYNSNGTSASVAKLTDASWYATSALNYILEGTVIYKV